MLIVSFFFSAYLALHRSSLVLISLTVATFCSFEIHTRSRHQKFHRSKFAGKLKSRLPFLPYSEQDFNNQFLAVMGSRRKRATQFSRKANLSAPLINYENGIRKTSFVQPHQLSGPKIRLFGGSTIDCQEVPDDYTIASQLQTRINSGPPYLNKFQVINYGVSGATLSASCEHFRKVEIVEDDICLFFFGANEGRFPTDFFTMKAPFSGIGKIGEVLDLLQRIQLVSLYRIFEKFTTINKNHQSLDQKVNEAEDLLLLVDQRCRSREVTLLAILQPLLHTKVPFTRFDLAMSRYLPKTRYEGLLYLFEKLEKRLNLQSFFFDGRGIFTGVSEDVFIDWVHTNYIGNKIIADYFYSVIKLTLNGQVHVQNN